MIFAVFLKSKQILIIYLINGWICTPSLERSSETYLIYPVIRDLNIIYPAVTNKVWPIVPKLLMLNQFGTYISSLHMNVKNQVSNVEEGNVPALHYEFCGYTLAFEKSCPDKTKYTDD